MLLQKRIGGAQRIALGGLDYPRLNDSRYSWTKSTHTTFTAHTQPSQPRTDSPSHHLPDNRILGLVVYGPKEENQVLIVILAENMRIEPTMHGLSICLVHAVCVACASQ
jgi:hypothetical protein